MKTQNLVPEAVDPVRAEARQKHIDVSMSCTVRAMMLAVKGNMLGARYEAMIAGMHADSCGMKFRVFDDQGAMQKLLEDNFEMNGDAAPYEDQIGSAWEIVRKSQHDLGLWFDAGAAASLAARVQNRVQSV